VIIKESLSKIDSAKAEAWLPADEEKVKKAIRESVGFEKVNSCVKRLLYNHPMGWSNHYPWKKLPK
jgi:hypothetical protein